MAKAKSTSSWGEFETMLLLELSSNSLEHYFSLKRDGKSDDAIKEEFGASIDKAPINLGDMLGDFTYSFLGDKSLKKWSLRGEIKNMPEQQKYALKKIGQQIKGNKVDIPEEERGFDYIIGYLKYLKNIKSDDKKTKSAAYERLSAFFGKIAEIAEREADRTKF